MNNLPSVVTQHCPEQDLNPRPIDRKSNALPVALPHHPILHYVEEMQKKLFEHSVTKTKRETLEVVESEAD